MLFLREIVFYQHRVQSADGLIGVDADLSGLFFQALSAEEFRHSAGFSSDEAPQE